MEAGDCTAGDGDEQGREEGGGAVEALPACECRQINSCAGEHDTDESDDHHAVEQEGGQVVTRLEQHPDRKQRSHDYVHCDEEDPEGAAGVDTEVQAGDGDEHDADDADDSGGADLAVLAVHEVTEDESDNDEQKRGGRGGGVAADVCTANGEHGAFGNEGAGHDCGEGSNDENENEQGEDGEQSLCLDAYLILDDFADGAAVVADGGEQSTKVMHCAEEDAADNDPQENGDPAENCGLDRSVDGACTGDGREVVAHQHGGVGRNEVLPVIAGVCRGFMVGVNTPLLCKPRAIEDVAQSKQSECDEKNNYCAHTFHSLNKKYKIYSFRREPLSPSLRIAY